MLTMTAPDASEPVVSPADNSKPPAVCAIADPHRVRHLLFGTLTHVQATIRHLHKLGYADPNDWSQPIPTDRPGEVMAILTKRVG